MKTQVVFETSAGLLSVPLSDMVTVPVKGGFYVYEGKRYEVAEVIEPLGSRGADGSLRDGDQKLIDLLWSIYGLDKLDLAAKIASIKNIGADTSASEGTTAGGVITLKQSFKSDFEHVLFVRLKFARNAPSSFAPLRLVEPTSDTSTSGDPAPSTNLTTSPGTGEVGAPTS